MKAICIQNNEIYQVVDISQESITIDTKTTNLSCSIEHEFFKVIDVDDEIEKVETFMDMGVGCYCGERNTCYQCENYYQIIRGLEHNKEIHEQ